MGDFGWDADVRSARLIVNLVRVERERESKREREREGERERARKKDR